MQLMRYQYTISHVAGKDLCAADMLSRAPSIVTDVQANQFQQEVIAYVDLIINHLPATQRKSEENKGKILFANRLSLTIRQDGQ